MTSTQLPKNAPRRWSRAAVLAATGAAVFAATGAAGIQTERLWAKRTAIHSSLASDALPIYLAGAAVLDGTDPTRADNLIAAYERRRMGTGALFFSTLYPATVAVFVHPLTNRTWQSFLEIWRALVLAGAVLAGAGGGLAAVRGRWTAVAIPLGALIAVGAFPLTGEATALGQANLLIAGLMGLAIGAMRRSRLGLAGSAAALGAGIKIVPALLFVPLIAGRRWRGVAVGAAVGVGLLGLTMAYVSLSSIVDGLWGTVQFQRLVVPDWMNRTPAPDWMIFLGALRTLPMGLATVVAITVCCACAPPDHQGSVLAASGAMASAWLATHAAAVGVFYATLMLPGLAFVALWPLDDGAPRWSWAWAPVAAVPAVLALPGLLGLADEPRMVLAGMVVWIGCAARLGTAAKNLPSWSTKAAVAVAAIGLLLAAVRVVDGPMRPPLVPYGMGTMPQGHGAGVGGIGPDRNWNPNMPAQMPGQEQAPADPTEPR